MRTNTVSFFVGAACSAVLFLAFSVVVYYLDGWASDKSTQAIEDLIPTLKEEEGFRSKPYEDSRGVLTIGYGINIAEGVTEAEAEFLLRNRLNLSYQDIWAEWIPIRSLPVRVQSAVLDMTYQLGVHGVLGFKDMLGHLARREFRKAQLAGCASLWVHETPVRAHRVLSRFTETVNNNPCEE